MIMQTEREKAAGTVLAPLPELRIFPTNGVTLANVADILGAGAAGVGFTTSLFEPGWMAAGDAAGKDYTDHRSHKAGDHFDAATWKLDGIVQDVDIDPGQSLYAVHSADGERLAVMIDRDTAFAAAVAHELEPVSVH